MEAIDIIKVKIAKSLLVQRDTKKRRSQVIKSSIVLLAMFLGHSYFTNLESPLKLIPQTMLAIGMGYMLLYVLSLRRFIYLIDFIDWEKVSQSIGQSDSSES